MGNSGWYWVKNLGSRSAWRFGAGGGRQGLSVQGEAVLYSFRVNDIGVQDAREGWRLGGAFACGWPGRVAILEGGGEGCRGICLRGIGVGGRALVHGAVVLHVGIGSRGGMGDVGVIRGVAHVPPELLELSPHLSFGLAQVPRRGGENAALEVHLLAARAGLVRNSVLLDITADLAPSARASLPLDSTWVAAAGGGLPFAGGTQHMPFCVASSWCLASRVSRGRSAVNGVRPPPCCSCLANGWKSKGSSCCRGGGAAAVKIWLLRRHSAFARSDRMAGMVPEEGPSSTGTSRRQILLQDFFRSTIACFRQVGLGWVLCFWLATVRLVSAGMRAWRGPGDFHRIHPPKPAPA